MKINARPLNEGETFVCSMKKAKEMFKNTDVHLNFAYYTRDYGTFAETQDRYFVKKRCRESRMVKIDADCNYAKKKKIHAKFS